MKCQNCGVNAATTSIKTNIGGKGEAYLLCADCAARLGFEALNPFGNFAFDGLLGSIMGGTQQKTAQKIKRCEGCGMSMSDIAENGKMGCAGCYTAFRAEFMPSIERIHGKAQHGGKRPPAPPQAETNNELDELKAQLKAAVESENYEQAAQLRDEIKQRGEQK